MKQMTKQETQWLQILLIVQLAAMVLTLLTTVAPLFSLHLSGNLFNWFRRIINLATLLCLLLLPGYFMPSAITKAMLLLCNLMTIALPRMIHTIGPDGYRIGMQIINWVTPFLAVASIYLEYNAHGRMVPKNGRAWKMLLIGSLSVTLVTNVMVMLLRVPIRNGVTWVISAYNVLARILTLAISLWYVMLLYKNWKAVKQEEQENG